MNPRRLEVVTVADGSVDPPIGTAVLQAPLPGLRPPGLVAASDLLRRGWTDGMIRDLLGAADTTARNPHCAHGHPMRLYATSRVAFVERSPSFRERLGVAQRKRTAGLAAARRRRAALLEWVADLPIVPPPIPMSRLARIATDYFDALPDTDLTCLPFVIDHVVTSRRDAQLVVYLALHMTGHEEALAPFIGMPGYPDAVAVIRRRILDAIAHAYPSLRESVRGVCPSDA